MSLWNIGEAPRDGAAYVVFGRVVSSDEFGGSSSPFLAQVRWISGATTGWAGWVDERGLSISSDPADVVRIDRWAHLPEGYE